MKPKPIISDDASQKKELLQWGKTASVDSKQNVSSLARSSTHLNKQHFGWTESSQFPLMAPDTQAKIKEGTIKTWILITAELTND